MITFQEFAQQVAELYERLFDLVFLRTSPMVKFLINDQSLSKKVKGWKLHELLLNTIEELNPGFGAPPFSREWRRYRLMKQRYTEGMDAKRISNEIAISRRQYYREHKEAIVACAEILWQQTSLSRDWLVENDEEWLSILKSEASLLTQTDQEVYLNDVVNSVIALLEGELEKQNLKVNLDLSKTHQSAPMPKYLLRQLLIELFSYFIRYLEHCTIHITNKITHKNEYIDFYVNDGCLITKNELETENIISTIDTMSQTINATFTSIGTNESITRFRLEIPKEPSHTILAIDDNADILALLERFLEHNPKTHLLTTSTVKEGLSIALKKQPDLIILDLMMPGIDGWEGLQMFKNNQITSEIPIVICSVMKQRELAFSLGANFFIEKPISESKLIDIVNQAFD